MEGASPLREAGGISRAPTELAQPPSIFQSFPTWLMDVSKWLPGPSRNLPLSVTSYQSPLVSFSYERGWRQYFKASGFPGPDEEYRLARDFFRPSLKQPHLHETPATVLDCSCGSGLFARRFAADVDLGFERVLALDFSEAMLQQADTFAAEQAGPVNYTGFPLSLRFLRGDVSRLPLQTDSLSGVHAGAALHCWPDPVRALSEITRVMRPGAVLVLTVLSSGKRDYERPAPLAFLKQLVSSAGTRTRLPGESRDIQSGFSTWDQAALRSLSDKVGLEGFELLARDPAFIMMKAEKPLHGGRNH